MPLTFKNIEKLLQFTLLDAARLGPPIEKARTISGQSLSLYRNRDEEKLINHAPYITPYRVGTDFAQWVFENGWGKSWGIFIGSEASFEELHKHFRKFLIVKDESERKLYFRFYDPRVLRVFLPTCTSQQLREFFGSVDRYIMEDEDSSRALVFSLDAGRLKTAIIDLTKEEVNLPPPPKKPTQRTDDVIV